MTLLYLPLAYMLGILLGQALWNAGWISCGFPNWLWLAPLAWLPLTPLLNRLPFFTPPTLATMRWPASAGFEPPNSGPSPALLAALLLSVAVGGLRYASHPLAPCWTPTDLAFYNLPPNRAFDRAAPAVTITGYISSYPVVADAQQRLHIMAKTVTTDSGVHTVQGELRLSTGIRQRHSYGQPVRVQGRLVTPPDFEDFSYREYLARKGIHSLLYSAKIERLQGVNAGNAFTRSLYALRARGEQLLNSLLPEPYAALTNGMLLGIDAGIPDALYEQFNLTGTSHTIVISGSNVAVISSLFMTIGLRLLGRRRAVWFTLLTIGCYALLVGGDAAVVRAAFMGGLYVVATALERRSTALVSLAVACWVMTIFNPLTLWDVGFQLSSAATAGLILFSPAMTAQFSRVWTRSQPRMPSSGIAEIRSKAMETLQGLIQDGLLTTVAANVTTLPLVVYYFGRISLVSLLTNFAIAPVQPIITLWGSVGILIGVLGLTWVAWLLLLMPWLSLVWTVTVVKWTAALPGASLDIASYNHWGLLGAYLAIGGFYWRASIRAWFQARWQRLGSQWKTQILGPGAVGLLSVSCILLWAGALSQPDGRLHLYFLDIGQGDGILIQTPSGRQVLIDGGPSPQQLFSQLGEVMPFWDRSLDMVVLTNPDKDHMDAQAQTPTRLHITTALETKASQANHDADLWRAKMAAGNVAVQVQHAGGWIDLGDGVALWTLWPPPEPFGMNEAQNEQFIDNENSLIMKLVYGDFSVLLTGDAGLPAEAELLAASAPLAATVLKVGHHGSKGSTGSTFVKAINPAVAVIQLSADNDYGHPHPEALARLAGRLILRNDLHGRIHIYSDGRQMWLEAEKADSLR